MPSPCHRALSALVFLVLATALGQAGEDNPAEERLFRAKKAYDAEVQKFRKAVTDQLDRDEEKARKKGDPKAVEQLKAERLAFEDDGELPRAVPPSSRAQMVAARAALETAYKTAIRDHLKAKQDDRAGAVEKELEEFKNAREAITAGPVQAKSVWTNDVAPKRVLTITERKGETFRARFEVGEKIEREVTGTVKGNKLNWLAKDMRVVRTAGKGAPVGDHTGIVIGDRIDFVWQVEGGTKGEFSLRLSR